MTDKPTNFEKDYSEDGFWDKCKKYAVTAGKEAMELALKMYYSARDPDTPTWAKSSIYASLGYFIAPVDAIPDLTPVMGFIDDYGVLTLAVGTVAAHIKQAHVEKAQQKIQDWFE